MRVVSVPVHPPQLSSHADPVAVPLFASGMYHNLGINWATSLLGFLAVALLPVPFLFYRYGARIRKLSKYSPAS